MTHIQPDGLASVIAVPAPPDEDVDWLRKRIAVRDLLEQVRQRIDPDSQMAVCPACAQLVPRQAAVDEHRSIRGASAICDPTITLGDRLAVAQHRAQAARHAEGESHVTAQPVTEEVA
ncbi:hypothetical protein KBX50_08470 [Micromonospora sp. C51]|uniref:hypothetical protein n=1 Tax=Micromonospora sp. C51 TaxID=2824879 RepID=UPI001B38B5D2|nr:hypothetical protein [Micromonospora sp. C51]MBQ1048497.1 hypothetical protein [Micromonospora sp. C51]